MLRRLNAFALLCLLAGCGGGSEPRQSDASGDRLLLLVWNYPDTGVTRLLVHLGEAETPTGSILRAPSDEDEGEVEANATLRSPAHQVALDGTYDHDGDYFSLTHRSGTDSIIMFGVYRPTQPLSPVIIDMTFSGPPAGNGSAYGVMDTTGSAKFFCGSLTMTDTALTRSFGLIVTDSLVIGLGGLPDVPFRGEVRGDSLLVAEGALVGKVSADRSTAAGAVTVLGHAGEWSAQRCDVN